jgi:hypothetical protein
MRDFRFNDIVYRIAILTLYIPLLKRIIYDFVHNWNHYKIRKQPKKPYILIGKIFNTFYFKPPKSSHDFQFSINRKYLDVFENFVIN